MTTNSEIETWPTMADVQRQLNVSRARMRAIEPRLRPVRDRRGHRRFPPAAIEAYLAERERPATDAESPGPLCGDQRLHNFGTCRCNALERVLVEIALARDPHLVRDLVPARGVTAIDAVIKALGKKRDPSDVLVEIVAGIATGRAVFDRDTGDPRAVLVLADESKLDVLRTAIADRMEPEPAPPEPAPPPAPKPIASAEDLARVLLSAGSLEDARAELAERLRPPPPPPPPAPAPPPEPDPVPVSFAVWRESDLEDERGLARLIVRSRELSRAPALIVVDGPPDASLDLLRVLGEVMRCAVVLVRITE